MSILWFGCYVAVIFGANWAIERFGIVPIGFGFEAPAGVFFAGLAFTFRDLLQESAGRRWTAGAIIVGAACSYWISPTFAMASAIAFGVSELVDFAVYVSMRRRYWLGAVALSNLFGLTVDSVLFLWLAFHSLAFIEGQIIAKAYMTAAAILVLWIVRHRALSIRRKSEIVPAGTRSNAATESRQ